MASSQDKTAALKLAQFDKAIWDRSNIKFYERILEKDGDVNYAVPVDNFHNTLKSYLAGCTVLHVACRFNIDVIANLLNSGADFTKNNAKGETALHVLIPTGDHIKEPLDPLDNPFIDAILLAHISTNNISNPHNNEGVSHFHIACMKNHLQAIHFFINSGVSVDEWIGENSKLYAGFTPLHIAAINANSTVAQILLERGANMHISNRRGITPLHVLIKRRIEMFDALCQTEGDSRDKLQEQIRENERIMNMLMVITNGFGFSNFHAACMLQNLSTAQHLVVVNLNHCVNRDSQLWPGYTALHFAAHVSLDAVEMLIRKGASIEIKDEKGVTPLDICIKRYKIEDVYRIMTLIPAYENLVFSDNVTKVVSFIQSLTDLKLFKRFVTRSMRSVNVTIPMDSPLWPGYTPLHLAVLFAKASKVVPRKDEEPKNDVDLQIIRILLKDVADRHAQDSQGRTALHLAFLLNKMTVVDVILRHCPQIPNLRDEDNLSHLHILCAVSKTTHTFRKCVLNRAEVNVAYTGTSSINIVNPGATPLHVCVNVSDNREDIHSIVKILLRNGADPSIRDTYGLTPIHWLLKHRFMEYQELLYHVDNDCVAEEYGINYLHVACHLCDNEAVEYFLENGANVNLPIRYTRRGDDDPLAFLAEFHKCTPLHLSRSCRGHVQLLMLEYGADVFAKRANGSTHLDFYPDDFVRKMWNDVDLQRRMRQEFGWTRLHLACYLLKDNGFEEIVRVELADINARVNLNSPIWKGCTPLHLLVLRTTDHRDMLMTLLENGADVTLIDEKRNSPIGMLVESSLQDEAHQQVALMMNYHRDFTVNPVNAVGISHFHLACYMNDLDAVRGFLSHGVDVNHPIDYFSQWCPGYTPLHLASQLQIVNLLIDYGADVNIRDVRDHSVLSEAIKNRDFDENVVEKIIVSGADVNYVNFRGKMPFEFALSKGELTPEKLTFFIRHGFHVNSCNPITGVGYIAIILGGHYEDKNLQMSVVERIINENSTDTLGRTTLHHIVTRKSQIQDDDYALLMEKLIRSGCGIDEHDNDGKTALHLAVEFGNKQAVNLLLMSGADINVADNHGNSALSYACKTGAEAINFERSSIPSILTIHARRLILLSLELNMKNKDVLSQAPDFFLHIAGDQDFRSQVVMSKEVELGVSSMRLCDFLSETGAVTMYPSLNLLERRNIDRAFESLTTHRGFKEIIGFAKLQYRKAIKRIGLLPSATSYFKLLLNFNLPDLCARNVFKYLSNADLKNIISAGIEHENISMDID